MLLNAVNASRMNVLYCNGLDVFCRVQFVRRRCIATYLSSIVHIRSQDQSIVSSSMNCNILARLTCVC